MSVFSSLIFDASSDPCQGVRVAARAHRRLGRLVEKLLRQTLTYLARRLTTPTGLFGEAWERFDGVPLPVEDMPHVWEHSLFYLAALKIDGARRYRFAQSDLLGNGDLDPLREVLVRAHLI